MADLNAFLQKLGLAPQSYENSPMDMLAPDQAPINQVVAEDEYDNMPATEADVPENFGSRQLATPEEIAKIQAIPLPEAQKSSRVPAQQPVEAISEPAAPQEQAANPTLSRYQELLNAYNDKNRNLGYLQAGNQIAQAIAMGSGAKIGDGSEAVNALRAQNQDPLKQLQSQDSAEMVDPRSDVSKMYREQAYAVLRKLNPEKKYDGTLENMSASQLLKLPGLKNALGGSNGRTNNRYVTIQEPDGTVRSKLVNMETGDIVKDLGMAGYAYGFQKDPLTGKPIALNKSDPTAAPVNPGGAVDLTKKLTDESTGEAKNISFGEFTREAPELAKVIRAQRDDLIKDMKDSREVATSVTNLSSKLKPGPNGEIDSGLLGGIQTQAAKMAGQKGVLTDQDLVKFAGAGGVKAKLNRIVDGSIFGEMTDEDIKFFKRFAQLMGKSLAQDVENRSQVFISNVKQDAEAKVPGITDENIRQWLSVDKMAPAVQGDEKITSNSKGEVRRKTADGQIAIFDAKTKKFLRYEE